MLAGILIIAFSLALLVYWFRYSCILILRSRTEDATDPAAVLDSRFNFVEIGERLKAGADLAALEASLERDYRLITYLIEHATSLELASLEDRLLRLDYRVMHLAYRVTRIAAPEQARKALSEMASVLGVLAHSIEQAGVQAES